MSGKYSKKLNDYAKQSAADAFKTYSRKSHSKNRELTGNLIGYKNANKITKVSKNSKQNKLETKNDKEIPNERYMSPEEKTRHCWWFKIKITA